jgi:hypothetical protein
LETKGLFAKPTKGLGLPVDLENTGASLQNHGIFLDFLELFLYWKIHELGSTEAMV